MSDNILEWFMNLLMNLFDIMSFFIILDNLVTDRSKQTAIPSIAKERLLTLKLLPVILLYALRLEREVIYFKIVFCLGRLA